MDQIKKIIKTPILQEGTPFCKIGCLQQFGLFVNFCPVAECGQRHPTFLCRCRSCNFPGFPVLIGAVKTSGQRFRRSAKADAPCLCCGNTLGLPLAEAVQLRAGVNHKDFFA